MGPITVLVLQTRKLRQVSLSAAELDLYGGEWMCNPAALFESFVFCFPYKRMAKSCDLIVLGGREKEELFLLSRKARIIKGWIYLMIYWFYG